MARDIRKRTDLHFDLFADLQEVAAKDTKPNAKSSAKSGANFGDTAIGLGHARRILVLAKSLHRDGVKVRCFFNNPALAQSLFASSMPQNTKETQKTKETKGTQETQESKDSTNVAIPFLDWRRVAEMGDDKDTSVNKRDMLIIDSYRMNTLPSALIDNYEHIACFHDDKAPPSFASIAICPSLLDNSTPAPERAYNEQQPIILKGGVYFPFDESLLKRREAYRTNERAEGAVNSTADSTADGIANRVSHRVLVWFGGDENGARILPVIGKLLGDSRLDSFSFDVVISPVIEPSLDLLDSRCSRLRLHHDISSMPYLLSSCSIYLGGAGVTSCEAALLGLRLIVCALTDNQSGAASAFSRAGASLFDINFPSCIVHSLIAITESREQELDFKHLDFDQFGAPRLSNALCDISLDRHIY